MQLTDEFLFHWFGLDKPDARHENQSSFSYAITPYESHAEYERDKTLLRDMNNASQPQIRFLMVHAAKVERTDKAILGF